MAVVKLPFTDGPRTDGNSEFEHMWVGDIGFDGDSVSGILSNSPNWLTSVSEGGAVSVPFEQLTDWIMASDSRAYGGFTVNLMRSRMSRRERNEHDQAWGLDFGDPADIQIEIKQESMPKAGLVAGLFSRGARQQIVPVGFIDHPMCVNMIPKIEAQLQADRGIASTVDDDGWTLLHQEALSGNLGVVKLLVSYGADASARNPNGYTAPELAQKIGWPEIADYIKEYGKT
jgi:uncharacterized protein YegJ (DUF2314 family)